MHSRPSDVPGDEAIAGELRNSPELIELVMDAMSGVVYELNLRTGATWRSRGVLELVGFGPEELSPTADAWVDRIHPHDRVRTEQHVAAALSSGQKRIECEYRMLHRDGRWVWVLDQSRVLYDEDGKPRLLVGCTISIDDRKHAQDDHAHSQRLLRSITENTPDIIARLDRNLRHLYVNRAIERMTGIRTSQFIGKTARELGMPDELCDDWERAARAAFSRQQPQTSAFSFPSPDRRRHFVARFMPELDDDGRCESVLCICSDVTQLHEAEAALERAGDVSQEVHRAKEQFLGVLSHDLREPLTPILTEAQLLEMNPSLGDDVRNSVRAILRNAELQARMIDDLLNLTRSLRTQVHLPPSPAPTPPVVQPVANFSGGPACRVLLVEDHLDTVNAMTRLIRKMGCYVATATTVAEALEKAEAEPFDLVISDIRLPDGSGHDLMRRLRLRQDIPGIALTGYAMEDDARRSSEAGFEVHLVKPVDFLALRDAVEIIFARIQHARPS